MMKAEHVVNQDLNEEFIFEKSKQKQKPCHDGTPW